MKYVKKSLGQNFLIDLNVIKKITETIDITDKNVLEIGPGKGALTDQILKKKPKSLTIIEKDLVSIFEKNRIKKIDTKNHKFDPNLHQAMSEVEDETAETGAILQEIQPGYMLGDRLLRPALVAVAKKKTTKNEEKNKKKEEN